MKISETKLRRIIREELQEVSIGTYYEDFTVEIDVSKTRHASERQRRHGFNQEITDEEIIATAEEATDKIINDILVDKIDVGDEIVIRDREYDLNLVCTLEPKDEASFRLVVITVMRKKNFKPKSGSKIVDIY